MAKLYFRYGVMGAGKSTMIIQVAYNYKRNNLKTLVIKPKIDTKGDKKIVSRIGIDLNVDLLLEEDKTIYNYLKLVKGKSAILVDECQFLNKKQAYDLWRVSKEFDIPVICYGLKSNFKGELFEGTNALIGYADEIEELKTICKCGKSARFNARKEGEEYVLSGEEIIIDGAKKIEYVPLCGECYLKDVIKMSN